MRSYPNKVNSPHEKQVRMEPNTTVIRNASSREIGPTVTAFLNTGGGRILIGITEGGQVVGISPSDFTASSIEHHLSNEISPRPYISVVRRPVGNSEVLLIYVPAGPEKPYVFQNRIYTWSGGKSRPATAEEISEMILGRPEASRRWEREPAIGVTMEDLDERQVFETIARQRNRTISDQPFLHEPVKFLETLNLGSSGEIRNSAVVLFAKNPSSLMPQTRVRIATFKTRDRTAFGDNRVLEGGLFDLFEKIVSFFEEHIPLISDFSADSAIRSDQRILPRFVMREAIMNALVHRDYSIVDANLMIGLHPDRIEIWNPGAFPQGLDAESLPRSHVSRPTNPDIAHVAFLRGLIEQWGTGAHRIVMESQNAGLGNPIWKEIGGGIQLTIPLTQKARAESERFPPRIMAFIRDTYPGQRITTQNYMSKWAEHSSQRVATKDLHLLIRHGYLLRVTPEVYERTDRPSIPNI